MCHWQSKVLTKWFSHIACDPEGLWKIHLHVVLRTDEHFLSLLYGPAIRRYQISTSTVVNARCVCISSAVLVTWMWCCTTTTHVIKPVFPCKNTFSELYQEKTASHAACLRQGQSTASDSHLRSKCKWREVNSLITAVTASWNLKVLRLLVSQTGAKSFGSGFLWLCPFLRKRKAFRAIPNANII